MDLRERLFKSWQEHAQTSRQAFAEAGKDALRMYRAVVSWPFRALLVLLQRLQVFADEVHARKLQYCRHYHLQMKDARTADGPMGSCQYLRVWLECIDCGEWWYVQGRSPGPLAHNVRDAQLRHTPEALKILSDNGIDAREYRVPR